MEGECDDVPSVQVRFLCVFVVVLFLWCDPLCVVVVRLGPVVVGGTAPCGFCVCWFLLLVCMGVAGCVCVCVCGM